METKSRDAVKQVINLKGEPLDLDYTFGSGQIFLWRKIGDWWLGNIGPSAVLMAKDGDDLAVRCEPPLSTVEVERFLALDVCYSEVTSKGPKDPFSVSLLERYAGLRILRQEPWFCLATYLVSASLSIEAIEKALGRISEGGLRRTVDGHSLNLFPGPAAFLNLKRPRRGYLGRKWTYIREAARKLERGDMDFQQLRSASYEEAWSSLVRDRGNGTMGVGPKVADCVLLFSLDKAEAFPIDRWVLRGLLEHYPKLVPLRIRDRMEGSKGSNLTLVEYRELSSNVRAYFGPFGGWIQECLFLDARTVSRPTDPWVA